jgi:CRISPR-associated protein Cst2
MSTITSVAISARVTLNLHNLNSEGTEGNQQQTRMVHVIAQNGQRAVVNGISGDMFKHILVEHLTPLLQEAGQPLSPGAQRYSPDRITTGYAPLAEFAGNKANPDSAVMDKMLRECAVTDVAGALLTEKRAVGRKSTVEFGWVVGLPELTTTEQYLHVKYEPEGRGTATGGETVAGRQALFHRPASSGVYALVCNLDLYRVGLNDITRAYSVGQADRQIRARALLQALGATLVKPSGAQRNTQAPHITACEGILAASRTSLPAPMFSPLRDDYPDQVAGCARALNRIAEDSVQTWRFSSLADAVDCLARLAAELEVPAERV